MSGRTIEDDAKLEMRLRLLPKLEKDVHNSFLYTDMFFLEVFQHGGDNNWTEFPFKEILTKLDHDSNLPKVTVIAGQVGAGKTTFARSLLRSWLTGNSDFLGINSYQFCLIVDGESLEKSEAWNLARSVLPDTTNHWGAIRVSEWLESANILLIIDDFLLDTGQEDMFQEVLNEWKAAKPIILTNFGDAERVLNNLGYFKSWLYCRFQKLEFHHQVKIVNRITMQTNVNSKLIEQYFLEFENNIPEILETFSGVNEICRFLALKSSKQDLSYSTITNFIWDSTFIILKEIQEQFSLPSEKINDWITLLGVRCYECLAGEAPLLGEEVYPLIESTKSIFPNIENSSLLLESLLSCYSSLYGANETIYCVKHKLQQEVLAAWYILQKVMDGMPIKRLLKKIKNEDSVAIHVGGLLKKIITEEHKFFRSLHPESQKREIQIRRVMRNLSLQTERSPDPISFTFKLLHEVECLSYLSEIFFSDAVFPMYLHIHDYGIYADSIKLVLNSCKPSKLHLLVRNGYKSPQLKQTLGILENTKVDLALAEMNHLDWGKQPKSDEFINVINNFKFVKLQDFIGSLKESTIAGLHLWESTRYLVCLRVRVCDGKSTRALIDCQNVLLCLIWLEIDFDFPLNEVFEESLPPISTPLVDLSFCGVQDKDVESLCGFLYGLCRRFSGLHIHQCSMSPQGVTEILKYFYRRDMFLKADPIDIDKYRKYRFPELSYVDSKELRGDTVQRLLGYDDRHHYSDNEVRSSYVAKPNEVHALKYCFASMEHFDFFIYSCSNYTVFNEINEDFSVRANRF